MAEPADLSPTIVDALYSEALTLADEARAAFDLSGRLTAASVNEDLARIAPELSFDRRAAPHRTRGREQLVDVEPVAAVGRDAAGGCMRLLQIAQLLELDEGAPDGSGRHAQAGQRGQARRSDRLAGIDVFSDECGQYLSRPR